MALFELTDDGTMDTVIRCTDCGEEIRFNFDPGPGEEDGEDAYDLFVESCIEDCTEQHECATEPTEPAEDDITTEDHVRFYQYGRVVLKLDNPNAEPGASDENHYTYMPEGKIGWRNLGTFATCEDAVRAYMKATQFWPNYWVISDHGNAHLITL